MKKTILTFISALALGTVGAQAQGQLDFNNLTAGAITTVSPAGFAAGAVSVDLYWVAGLNVNTATVLSTGTYFQTGATALGTGVSEPNQDNFAGFFFGGVLVVPGTTPAGNYSMVVVAYSGAATYSAALLNPTSYVGNSTAFNHALVTGATPPTSPNMLGFAIAPIPEPSTFALAGLGLAGLLIFRRRN